MNSIFKALLKLSTTKNHFKSFIFTTLLQYKRAKYGGGGGAIRPLPKASRNSTETEQSGYAPRSGPEIKNGRSSARRWRAGEARMRDSQGRGKSDPADGVRRRCMKNDMPNIVL